MLGIGEFAGLTGLSVKALRHYGEKQVLVPAEVEERTGYRRYAESQVRDGVIVRALRDGGVALPEVAAALADGSAAEALTQHRRRVLEEREREDRAHDEAKAALHMLRVPVEVAERECEPQPYVGRVIAIRTDDVDELTDDHAGDVFREVFEQVRDAGLGPSGHFWTTMRAGDRGEVEIVCCWPTVRQADAGWGGDAMEVGTLPARTELVASWHPGGSQLAEGYTDPAVVALFEAIAERGIDLRDSQLRQRGHGTGEDDWTIEIAITAGPR